MPNDFALHPRLAADSVRIGILGLCDVRLILDANYPWIVLVPMRAAIREIHDLAEGDQAALWRELTRASEVMQRVFAAEKVNVAALGNMVPQLHVHVIARLSQDAAWPGAIWGHTPATSYEEAEQSRRIAAIAKALGL